MYGGSARKGSPGSTRIIRTPSNEVISVRKTDTTSRRQREIMNSRGSYGKCSWFFLDRCYLTSMVKFATRAACKPNSQCFTYDELTDFENNTYIRNYMIGSSIGVSMYLILFICVISGTNDSSFALLSSDSDGLRLCSLILLTISSLILFKIATTTYLNAYIIFGLQVLYVVFTILGTYALQCNQERKEINSTDRGQLAFAFIGSLSDNQKLQDEFYQVRCKQSAIRLGAMRLLNEVICFILSVRLITL